MINVHKCPGYVSKTLIIWKEKHTDRFGGDKDFGVCFKLGFVWKDWTSWYWIQYTVYAKNCWMIECKTRPKLMTHLRCNFWLIPSHTTTYHPIQSHTIPYICIWKMIINIAVSTDAWHTEEPETICSRDSHEPGSRANVRTGLTHTLGRLEIAGITGLRWGQRPSHTVTQPTSTRRKRLAVVVPKKVKIQVHSNPCAKQPQLALEM